MINFFERMDPKRFRLLSALFCALGDWIICVYVFATLLSNKAYMTRLLEAVAASKNISPEALNPEMIEQFFQKSLLVSSIVIAFVLIFNTVFYVLFYKGKKGVVLFYMKSLIWLGALFYFIFAITSLGQPLFATILFIQVLLYSFVILGLKHVKLME